MPAAPSWRPWPTTLTRSSPRCHHIVALEAALVQHARQGGRRLDLHQDLRLRGLSVSERAAALISVVAHDSTREQLKKVTIAELPRLLHDGLADLVAVRELDNTTIKIDELRGTRLYRLEPLLEVSRVTGLTDTSARQILTAPHDWPSNVVQVATQRLSQKAARAKEPLMITADEKDWLPGTFWRPRHLPGTP